MRPLITLLMLLVACAAQAQDWTQVDLGTSEDLLRIEDTSFSASWVVGRGGFAALSDYYRNVWTVENVGTTVDLNSVLQPSQGQVWLGTGNGTVRRYFTDHWESRNLPAGQDYALFTRGSGTAGAVGTAGDVRVTLDGGDTWELRNNLGVSLHDAKGFVDDQFWVVGDAGLIAYTSDGGDNFALQTSGTTADLYAFHEGVGVFAVGAQGTILKSADGGATWQQKNSGTSATLRDIGNSGQNGNWMLVVGDHGTVLKSTDAGETWCRLFPETTANLYSLRMVTNSEYFAAGENGTLIRTTTGGGDCISVAADFLPSSGLELSLYPNPLTGAGRVDFASERAGAYALSVFDPAGRRVAELERGSLAAGESRGLALDTRGWSAGVYFLRLDLGERRETRRFTVLR